MEHFYEGLAEIFASENRSNAFVLLTQIIIGVIILSQHIQMF